MKSYSFDEFFKDSTCEKCGKFWLGSLIPEERRPICNDCKEREDYPVGGMVEPYDIEREQQMGR